MILVTLQLNNELAISELLQAKHAFLLVGLAATAPSLVLFPRLPPCSSHISEHSVCFDLSTTSLPLELHEDVANTKNHERNNRL